MRSTRLIPVAVLAFAVACSDTATSPTSVGVPLFDVAAGTYTDPLADPQTGIQDANAPSGAHLTNQSGPVQCVVNSDLSISCSAYSIAGVGNTNAFLSLEAVYTAIIDCNNPGNNKNNPIESHETTFSTEESATLTPGRNGTLRVGARSVSPFDEAQGCPNPNWQPEIREGSLELVSFTYSLHFDGFPAGDFAVLIEQP
ncbi:MAG: hypothetical protein ACREOC_04560 [Gemmatimonadales bacterium]